MRVAAAVARVGLPEIKRRAWRTHAALVSESQYEAARDGLWRSAAHLRWWAALVDRAVVADAEIAADIAEGGLS